MERLGLVSQLERELERIISLGLLPEDGVLPSEQSLARRYAVSRSTAREALLRLSARGLVVQHPGRRARAVALDEALTLENLGLALHGEGSLSPERRLLLEGYLSLRREVTVELLSTCCEHASEADLDRLGQACFALEDAARWVQDRSRWVALEFELLRLAAAAASRPGHLLLIQSLERAFRAMAERVLPCMDSQSISQWARCAMDALAERQVQALRTHLSELLLARDERVLAALAPTHPAAVTPEASGHREQTSTRDQTTEAPDAETQALQARRPCEPTGAARQSLEAETSVSEPTGAEVSGASRANLYGCQTGSWEAAPSPAPPVLASSIPDTCRAAMLSDVAAPGDPEVPAAQVPSATDGWGPSLPLRNCPRPGVAALESGHSTEDLPTVEPTHDSPDW